MMPKCLGVICPKTENPSSLPVICALYNLSVWYPNIHYLNKNYTKLNYNFILISQKNIELQI